MRFLRYETYEFAWWKKNVLSCVQISLNHFKLQRLSRARKLRLTPDPVEVSELQATYITIKLLLYYKEKKHM